MSEDAGHKGHSCKNSEHDIQQQHRQRILPCSTDTDVKLSSKSFVVDAGIGLNSEPSQVPSPSLQEAFLKFRRERQNEIRQIKRMAERKSEEARDPARMAALREKFLDQARKYFGVPYGRKYWKPEEPEHQSPLFLDCCGLVRQIVRDLREDFGFKIGSWNQSYMYDTLPLVLTESEMKPGDLVFISATYFNTKARRQRHDMVHVEIWLGDGPKTIGARWQRGKVQIFPHYAFEAKSYHSPTYHFRSIDTWLMGICHSYCSEHPWKKTTYSPNKHSVFNVEEEKCDDESAGDTDEDLVQDIRRAAHTTGENQNNNVSSETDNSTGSDRTVASEHQSESSQCHADHFPGGRSGMVLLNSSTNEMVSSSGSLTNETDSYNKDLQNCDRSTCTKHLTGKDVNDGQTSCQPDGNFAEIVAVDFSKGSTAVGTVGFVGEVNEMEEFDVYKDDVSESEDLVTEFPSGNEVPESGANKEGFRGNHGGSRRGGDTRRSQAAKSPGKVPQVYSLVPNMQPTFYIGGGNGVSLVEGPLTALGWKRITEKSNENFRLRWVECKGQINYATFKEGEQLVNHIPNCQILTNKLGLINSLQEYERVTMATKGRPPRLRLADFIPETYKLDEKNDREAFLNAYKDGETWICKPTGLNQGKGIYLIRSKEEITKGLEERDLAQQARRSTKPLMSRVIQRYIEHPLLLDGRKFDIRAYMLIGSTVPYLVLYHKGYIRLSCQKYIFEDTDMTIHLTNQYIQKKDPQYAEVKEDTAWSMDKFNDYVNQHFMVEKGIEKDWVFKTLTKEMQKIIVHCFHSVKHKLQCKIGYFDLYGLDFMIDQNMKVSLIEININPSLATNCEALREVIPGVVEETLHLVIECFEKSRRKQALLPLKSLKNMVILHCGTRLGAVKSRTARSVSPGKESSAERSRNPPKSSQVVPPSNKQYLPSTTSFAKDSPSFGNSVRKPTNVSMTTSSSAPAVGAQQSSPKTSPSAESIKLKMTHGNSSEKVGKAEDTDHADRGN